MARYNKHAVYISYARNDANHPGWEHIADVVEPLARAIRNAGITCYTDTADIANGESITDFENAIGNGECVILVFSQRYFQRPHCMYEFVQIKNGLKSGKIKKVFLIKAGVCNFDDLNFINDLYGEWGKMAKKFEKANVANPIMEKAKKYNYYDADIDNLKTFFSTNNYDTVNSINQTKLIEQIKVVLYVSAVNTPDTNNDTETSSSTVKDFLKRNIISIIALILVIFFAFYKNSDRGNDKPNVSDTSQTKQETPSQLKQEPSQPKQETPSQPKQSTDDLAFSVKNVSFKMKYVAGGSFLMGASEQGSGAYDREKPAHLVTLSSYYICETEVTQGLWKAVMGSNPSSFKKGDNYPVEEITWYDAVMFCNKLSEATNREKVYTITDIQYGEKEQKNSIVKATVTADSSKNGFCLPTEAQWEYAARGGKHAKHRGNTKYSGSNNLAEVAWYGYIDSVDKKRTITSKTTMPVAQKKPNFLGIYDMSGNVWEWCQDWYGKYYYKQYSQTDPQGPSSGSERVLRGGSWYDESNNCRVLVRVINYPDGRDEYDGMRLALPCPTSKN